MRCWVQRTGPHSRPKVPVAMSLGAAAGLVMAGVAALVAQSIVGISLFLSTRRSH